MYGNANRRRAWPRSRAVPSQATAPHSYGKTLMECLWFLKWPDFYEGMINSSYLDTFALPQPYICAARQLAPILVPRAAPESKYMCVIRGLSSQ